MGKAIRKSSIGTRMGRSSRLGMLIRYLRKGLFLSVYVDDIKLGGIETEHLSDLENPHEDVDLGEPTPKSLTTFTWVALKENEKSVKILLTILNDLCRSYRKITQLGET